MRFPELEARLLDECFVPTCFSVGDGWDRADDVECLARVGDRYEIFYVERGRRQAATAVFDGEEEACDAYYALLLRNVTARTHCLGLFADAADADRLCAALAERGLPFTRDRIPWNGPASPRFRVFVLGKDVIVGRTLAAALPGPRD